jgi:predicted TIM-barrel fold metal-dependent hydrolase
MVSLVGVIDFRVRLPTSLRPEDAQAIPESHRAGYDSVFDLGDRRGLGLDALRAEMAEAGVERAGIHAEYEHGDPADAMNEAVAAAVEAEPARFFGVGTISLEPLAIRRAIGQVDAVASLGLAGLNLQPSFFGIAPDDRRLYPVYARAAERGLFVCLHTGINYTDDRPLRLEPPLLIDQVACDFPELDLVACHAGWPWTTDLAAVARKHPSVYLEFGGIAPRYVAERGTGWEVMFRFMNSLLIDQVLFGTDWPVMSLPRVVDEWQAAGLKDQVLQALLGGNARRLLETALQPMTETFSAATAGRGTRHA